MGWDPFWAWVCSVLDPQDSIKELFNCVLRVVGNKNGGPMVDRRRGVEPMPGFRRVS